MTKGTPVTIEGGTGQHLTHSVGQAATVIKTVGPFVILSVGDNVRTSLAEYVQPKVTADSLAARQNA